jgi:hypothetical protein
MNPTEYAADVKGRLARGEKVTHAEQLLLERVTADQRKAKREAQKSLAQAAIYERLAEAAEKMGLDAESRFAEAAENAMPLGTKAGRTLHDQAEVARIQVDTAHEERERLLRSARELHTDATAHLEGLGR